MKDHLLSVGTFVLLSSFAAGQAEDEPKIMQGIVISTLTGDILENRDETLRATIYTAQEYELLQASREPKKADERSGDDRKRKNRRKGGGEERTEPPIPVARVEKKPALPLPGYFELVPGGYVIEISGAIAKSLVSSTNREKFDEFHRTLLQDKFAEARIETELGSDNGTTSFKMVKA